MSLKDTLMQDFKEAMKAHDEVRKSTVNLARAAIKQYEVDNRKELDDQGVIEILTKQVKMRKDALSDFEKAGRTDLAETYHREIEILMAYLPAQLSEAEIAAIEAELKFRQAEFEAELAELEALVDVEEEEVPAE